MDELTRLALAARSGAGADVTALVRAGYREIWTLCSHLVDPGAADDLTQETYLRIMRALPSYRQEASARTWMLAIARRTCMDELRARSRRRAREELTATPADRAAPAEPDTTDLRWLLATLAPERRAAFALTQILGLRYDDAAAVCGCSPGTVRSRVARARTQLLGRLDPAVGDRDDCRARRSPLDTLDQDAR